MTFWGIGQGFKGAIFNSHWESRSIGWKTFRGSRFGKVAAKSISTVSRSDFNACCFGSSSKLFSIVNSIRVLCEGKYYFFLACTSVMALTHWRHNSQTQEAMHSTSGTEEKWEGERRSYGKCGVEKFRGGGRCACEHQPRQGTSGKAALYYVVIPQTFPRSHIKENITFN